MKDAHNYLLISPNNQQVIQRRKDIEKDEILALIQKKIDHFDKRSKIWEERIDTDDTDENKETYRHLTYRLSAKRDALRDLLREINKSQ